VTDAHLTVVGDRSGNAKRLKSFPQRFGDFGCFLLTFFDRNGRARQISPSGVFKRNRLNVFYNFSNINAF
jgi:hypothetical protein